MGRYPTLKRTFGHSNVVWVGAWCPSVTSDTYEISITYTLRIRPKVSIVSPKLTLAEGKTALPHAYGGSQHDICIHERHEWTSRMYIADTIMPWLSQWLYFYEIWKFTGSWEGKGSHPELESHKSNIYV
jgi:hypothetical protein